MAFPTPAEEALLLGEDQGSLKAEASTLCRPVQTGEVLKPEDTAKTVDSQVIQQ